MKNWIRRFAPWAGVVLCGMACAQSTGQTAPITPTAAFFKPPMIERAVLSPSGRWLAFVAGAPNGRNSLVVFDVNRWQALAAAAYYEDADIHEFQWVNDRKLVYSLTDRQRGGGDQVRARGLYSVGRDGTERRELVTRDRVARPSHVRAGREPLAYNHELIVTPRAGGDEVIVGEYRWDSSGEFKEVLAKRLNIETGFASSLSVGTPPNVWNWWFDNDGQPRLLLTRREGIDTLHWRAGDQRSWQAISSFPSLEAPFQPHSMDGPNAMFVVARGSGGYEELQRVALGGDKLVPQVLVSAPGFDFIGQPVHEPDTHRLLGFRVVTDGETTVWSNPTLAALQKEADANWPAHNVRLDCVRCAEADITLLARIWSDVDPGQYWIRPAESRRWRKVGDARPEIDPAFMSQTSIHRVKARDGIEIPVWVTLPASVGKKPRAAVVLVHGGPWVRGQTWNWSEDAQYLASRGYVVIEPEFRGSLGYGYELYRAGWKQWGRAMQDDLADALSWAIDKSWVDAKRVCIVGASYGGYAVLMGLIRHPDLYRCGAAWAGVTDPRLLFEWLSQGDMHTEFREFQFPILIGDPVSDAEMLDSVTPVLHADKIRAPLLLAYGSSDRRVPPVHGTRLRDALIQAGRPPEWILYPGEGHGWYQLENRVDFAQRLEAFLARHLN